MTELTADEIRAYREGAGLSVAEAARELCKQANDPPTIDSVIRSWKRWEKGTRPSRAYRALLRGLLAAAEPMAPTPAVVDLTGDWWAAWQTYRDGEARYTPQSVRLRQNGNDVRFWAITRGVPVDVGGYLWSGEMRVWDNEILMGWYAAEDGSVRSKGTVYFVLHPHGQVMHGRWTGLSYDGPVIHGLAVMGRTKPATVATMKQLADQERNQRGPHR